MLNVFISQPMKGLADYIIFDERLEAIQKIMDIEGDVNIIDSYISEYTNNPLWYFSKDSNPLEKLGISLMLLSNADVAYFMSGWEENRGCRIEHECCVQYGIPVLYL